MKMLCLNTSDNVCSVAFAINDKVTNELSASNEKTHSENLMPLIKELLDSKKISFSDINAIACIVGPGSFTGLRIGISSCKAMAEILQVPILAVSSLEALSYNIEHFDGIICSLIDAKHDSVYYGIFDSLHNLVKDYNADTINNVLTDLENYNKNILFVGNGAILYKDLITKTFEKKATFLEERHNTLNNDAFARAAFAKYTSNNFETADSVDALYLRKSQAERMKEINEQNSNQ